MEPTDSLSDNPRHDKLCGWHTATGCFDPADNCWECAIITRTRTAMRAEYDGHGCVWPDSDCLNGPECLCCRKLNALIAERSIGYRERQREETVPSKQPCGHDYWICNLDGTTRCADCGVDTTHSEDMGH